VSDSIRVEVEGAQTVALTLAAAGAKIDALAPTEVGALVARRAQGTAPYRTGALRRSIAGEASHGRVRVSSGLPYSGVIHNGWAAHNIRPHPYLIPVAEDSASIWGPMYRAEVSRIISTTVRGA
jgi:hypothetical protein